MAPKKQSAFMKFVLEWNKRHHLSIPQAVSQCGEIWKKMTEQEKGSYKGFAKDANLSRPVKEKLDCKGRALSEVRLLEREAAENEMKKKRAIENIVMKAKAQHDLENTEFMCVAFNYFTKAIGTDVYLPAEFAACQFSLKSGKLSIYSSHINPEQLIFGHGSDAQSHTTSTHQLPLPPNAIGENNMGRLYANIVEYLRNCQGEDKPLVVFTTTALMPVVNGCFRYLQSDSDLDVDIEVYDIQYLFYVLKKQVMDVADLPINNINKGVTDNFFLRDFFQYSKGIACEFHEELDRGRYCTQSMVSQWCYTFCDYMCSDLAIKPLPGKHMPHVEPPNYRVTNANQHIKGNTSYASSQVSVKQEPESQADYVPLDPWVFSGNLSAPEQFPSLGTRKRKSDRNPQAIANEWNVPAANNSFNVLDDAFNMFRS